MKVFVSRVNMILSFSRHFFLVNGVWGQWSSFTECSMSCDGGTQTRRRVCDSPAPAGVGDQCPGDAEEAQSCNSDPCPGMCNLYYRDVFVSV